MRRTLAFAASTMLVVTVAACSHSKAAARARSSTSASSTSTTAPVPVVKTEKLTGGTTAPYVYDYTVEYGQLDGLRDQDEQRAINAELARAASNLVGDFVARVTEEPPTSTSTSGTGPPSSNLRSTTETTLLDARLVSVRMQADFYILGDAHGSSTVLTFTYDLSTGRRLMLADLFRSDSGYLDFLSRESLRQLSTMSGYAPDIATAGTTPTADHFAAFSLTAATLQVTFAVGQVAPTVANNPRVSFPYAQLRPLLATPGPLDGR